MGLSARRGRKEEQLRADGALHPHPERVQDALFRSDPFFDARDLIQVRYEMVRRVRVEKRSVQSTAQSFGVTRPTFYEAQARLTDRGLPGLLP
ncbi:MAG: helix-turn-helix domain-containing protein, partial [Thermoplasmata archaeon]